LWVAAFCSSLVFSQFGTTYSVSILRRGLTLDAFGFRLAPEAVYGVLMSWNGLLIVFAELPLTSLTLRFNARRVMALGYVLIGFGFALNGWCRSISSLYLAMTIFTIGEMISAPTTSAFVARLAPERLRGRYMGVLMLAWHASAILGPQFGLRLFALDPRFVWFGCAALGLTAAATTLASGKSAMLLAGKPECAKEPDPVGVP
jgi:MFS family permease